MEVVRSLSRRRKVGYHLAEAEAWLVASERGAHTTLLAYAAYELRLEIERLTIELLVRVQDGLKPGDAKTLRSFSRVETQIYKLEGHQLEIDKKVEMANLMLETLGID